MPEHRDDTSPRVGAAVRAARERAGLTTRALAAEAGISQPFLSQVERGLNSPSINTLYRLAEALGVTPADLLPPPAAPRVQVVRADERELAPANELSNTARARIARGAGLIAEIVEYLVEPGEDVGGWFWRESDHAMLVLRGQVRVDLEGEESVRLGPGDCLFHPGAIRHRWERLGDEALHVVLLISSDIDVRT
ncbi:XRE family transcriptional regulator [Saccharopolyspora sp. NPDC050389]|uniref:helix-turn-helix domain-containing protein n=1 Tax=Saccharopolyspora sp. NPDC050389 TaxID=3155516 RepID=UPI00340AB233